MNIIEKQVHPAFSEEEKRKICEEVLNMQLTTNLKVSEIIKIMGEKYNFKAYTEIYRWNKYFGNIFKLDRLSKQEKMKICEEVNELKEQTEQPLKEILRIISKKYNTSVGNIHRWNREYKIFTFDMTDDDRKKICYEVKDLREKTDLSIKEIFENITKKYNIKNKVVIYKWNKKFGYIFTFDTLTDSDRQKICEQIRDLQMSTDMKLSDIIRQVAKKYNYKYYGDVYGWNKEFGYIFEILTDEKRKQICEEVKNLSDSSDLKVVEILKIFAKKYNISNPNIIYVWNKKFGYIFELDILSKDERKKVCEEIKNLKLTTNQSYIDIVKFLSKKYKVQEGTIYKWNREFDYIFDLDLFLKNEEKIAILQEVLNMMKEKNISAAKSVEKISTKYSITETCIYRWNRKFQICKTLQKFNEPEKIAILKEIKDAIKEPEFTGATIIEYAKKYGISLTSIYYWNRKYKIIITKSMEGRKNPVYEEKFIMKVLDEFKTIPFTRENINIVAEQYGITEAHIWDWNRRYNRFETLHFKKGKDARHKKEVMEKLATDKEFKDKILHSIKQKSKE